MDVDGYQKLGGSTLMLPSDMEIKSPMFLGSRVFLFLMFLESRIGTMRLLLKIYKKRLESDIVPIIQLKLVVS